MLTEVAFSPWFHLAESRALQRIKEVLWRLSFSSLLIHPRLRLFFVLSTGGPQLSKRNVGGPSVSIYHRLNAWQHYLIYSLNKHNSSKTQKFTIYYYFLITKINLFNITTNFIYKQTVILKTIRIFKCSFYQSEHNGRKMKV